jgi:hypothetical protein
MKLLLALVLFPVHLALAFAVVAYAIVKAFFWWMVGCGVLFVIAHFVIKEW